jgi:hypothetical protein
MTPSNHDNNQPLIYRIADAAGIFHLVAPVNHTHSQSEIQGLEAALSVKQDALTFDTTPTEGSTNPVTSGGVKEAIDNHIVSTVTRDDFESGKYAQVFVLANGGVGVQTSTGFGVALQVNGNTKWFMVDPDTIDNIIRASQSPDSTPTANSNKLVTSDGVAAALAAKNSIDQVDDNDNQEAHLDAIAEDDDVYFKFQLKNGNTEKQVLLTVSKMDNFARAISNPDTTPTSNSTNLVTSGGVKAALVGKADKDHTHTPTEVQGVIPSFVEWTGQTLDLDAIIDGTLGMVRLMIYNNDSNDTTFGDLFESSESLPIHLNANAATAIETQHYAICTIYKMDKSQTPSEHDHDLCYFITLDGVFNDGNPAV